MSLESRVENFFRGLVGRKDPPSEESGRKSRSRPSEGSRQRSQSVHHAPDVSGVITAPFWPREERGRPKTVKQKASRSKSTAAVKKEDIKVKVRIPNLVYLVLVTKWSKNRCHFARGGN